MQLYLKVKVLDYLRVGMQTFGPNLYSDDRLNESKIKLALRHQFCTGII